MQWNLISALVLAAVGGIGVLWSVYFGKIAAMQPEPVWGDIWVILGVGLLGAALWSLGLAIVIMEYRAQNRERLTLKS